MSIKERFDDLPKDQQYILTKMYQLYFDCVKDGSSKRSCNFFENIKTIYPYFNHMHVEDLVHDCIKLRNKGFLHGNLGDNTIFHLGVTDDTVSFFENKLKNDSKEVYNFVKEVASWIPGLG
ncbi:hypothetical protein ACUXOE_001839 [Staphylococcus cohnii]|nr:hypothetical protein [Staphylococcus saprophyticus]MDW4045942.1 hypothetical protein [Staphylococcus saprophyticus]MDW4358414.1 hypothetical protein [Staphylococcus saprophyticus]